MVFFFFFLYHSRLFSPFSPLTSIPDMLNFSRVFPKDVLPHLGNSAHVRLCFLHLTYPSPSGPSEPNSRCTFSGQPNLPNQYRNKKAFPACPHWQHMSCWVVIACELLHLPNQAVNSPKGRDCVLSPVRVSESWRVFGTYYGRFLLYYY